MKRKILLPFSSITAIMLFLPLLFACGQKIKGSGNVISEKRDVSGYKIIHVSGGFVTELVPGNTEGITIEADDNLMPSIITKVSSNTLNLSVKGTFANYKTLKATIYYKDLEKLKATGAVKIKQTESSKHNTLFIELNGASNLKMALAAKSLAIEGSGSSDIELKGSADNFDLDISGAGEVKATRLEAKNCKVSISGSGDADIFVTEKLDAEISGAGAIRYKGDPEVNKNVSGAGSVQRLSEK
jgi:Putative auto-transporter adhesin, head GIN domain